MNMNNTPSFSEFPEVIGNIKRFLELWCSNEDFRHKLADSIPEAMADVALPVDAEEIRVLWDSNHAIEQDRLQAPLTPIAQQYRDFNRKKGLWRDEVRLECSPSHPRFKEWRERQMARCSMQMGEALNVKLIHTPISFELADGCSVGCRFCGVNAPPLSHLFSYTPENARLFQDILRVSLDLIGPAARWGTCYFATEPMDNPDYEKFCIDFSDILGMFPQTTTALPMKDPRRTHRLLKLARSRGCRVDRFSILSLGMLEKVHREFSATELTDVELILQNPESTSLHAASGKFRTRILQDPSVGSAEISKMIGAQVAGKLANEANNEANNEASPPLPPLPGTISCITGFLVNMVNRTCRLISPWNADDRWPNGYIIHDEGTFTDAASFRDLLEKMMVAQMPLSVSELKTLSFRRGLKYKLLDFGFEVADTYKILTMNRAQNGELLRYYGELIREGQKSANQIALLAFYKYSVPEDMTINILDFCFKNGILNEEPAQA